MNLKKLVALLLVLSLFLTPVLACGGGDHDDDGNGGNPGNGGGDDDPGTDPGDGDTPTDPGTGGGSGAGPGHVAEKVSESGGFYGSIAFKAPSGELINSDFERYCYYKELLTNDSFRDWARRTYPTPFNDGELFDWAKGKKIETALDHANSSIAYEAKTRSIYGLTCEQIFPPAKSVSLGALPLPNSTASADETPESYPKSEENSTNPFLAIFAVAGVLSVGYLVLRQRK